MKLGKRYMALADNGLGLRVAPVLPAYKHVAEEAIAESQRRGVLCLDFDVGTISPVDESDEEAYARNERVMLAAAAEVERLKPIVGAPMGTKPKADETEPVADITFEPWPPRRQGGQHVGYVYRVHERDVERWR